jgi:exodeoxyribonuclease VII large subunit
MELVYSVSEFIDFINAYLEGTQEVVVRGEISSIKLSQGRWYFITIKDEESSVDVFAVGSQIPLCRQLEEGMLINVYGYPKLYKKSGRFSLNATNITPAGEGELKLAFEKLKLKLEAEGLFDPSRKREITKFPQNIGLITAKHSQAYNDFVKVLTQRVKGVKIYYYPASVQGRSALSELTNAILYFNSQMPHLDVLVLTRGGGSLEDLYTFNTEELARAIYSSKIPVVTGVGHEGDITLADLCADLRASTPSNAAELISREMVETLNEVKHMEYKILSLVQSKIDEQYNKVDHFAFTAQRIMSKKMVRVQNAVNSFERAVTNLSSLVTVKNKDITWISEKLLKTVQNQLVLEKMRLKSLNNYLNALDYKKMLKRGFAVVYGSNGQIVKSCKNVKINDTTVTMLADGILHSKVEKVEND